MSEDDKPWFQKGTKVLSRDGKRAGEMTGSRHHCRMEGCRGSRIAVRWQESTGGTKVTFPCSRGLEPVQDGWQIK